MSSKINVDTPRDALISDIYNAAIEPDGFLRIAESLKRFFDVDSAGLWLVERETILDLTVTSDIAESTKPYLEHYQLLDPWTNARKSPGLTFLSSDHVADDELRRSEFYNDFARHYGMVRPLGAVVDVGPGVLGSFALNRTASSRLLDSDDKAVLQSLVVHLRGAMMLRSRFLSEQRAGTLLRASLDEVSFGVVTCTSEAGICSVNQAALDLATQGAGIVLGGRGTGLRTERIHETRRLHSLIQHAARGQAGAMRLESRSGVRLSVLVTPLQRLEGLSSLGDGATLVCVSRDTAPPALNPAILIRLFGLSPAQAALCILLVAGHTFEEAAADRGIAVATARSHFSIILERTGARNLRDLLRLLASLPALRG